MATIIGVLIALLSRRITNKITTRLLGRIASSACFSAAASFFTLACVAMAGTYVLDCLSSALGVLLALMNAAETASAVHLYRCVRREKAS